MSTLVTTALRHNASASNNIVMDSSGRVGIATTPSDNLTVSSSIGIRNSNFAGINYFGSSVNGAGVYTGLDAGGGFAINVRDSGYQTFSTNNTERMRIDASGRVTTPAQPAFYARGAETNQTLGNQGDLILATAIYNIGGHYNTSNYRFTAPVAGRYLFTWSVFINVVAGRCTLKVNGSSYNNLQMDVGAGLSQSAILNLAANDYVTVGDWQNISGMQYYGGHTHFSGILLS